MLDLNKTYVYDGTEVVLTGRRAQRERLRSNKVDELHEVKPQDEELGSWKKWVREVELYEIIDSNE